MYGKYKDGEITPIQTYIILVSIMIGTGILGLSRVVAEVSRQDAWISVLLNGLFISLIIIIIIYTISKFPQFNFLEYVCHLLSKPIGYIITIAFIAYSILATGTIMRFLAEMIGTWFLPKTPSYIIILIIAITVVYMTRNGLTVLARFNEVIAFLLIPFVLLVFVGLSELNFIHIRPIGGSGIKNIIAGVVPSFYAFGGYEVMMVIYPYISNKKKPILKYSVLAILLVTLFYSAIVFFHIALFGPDEIQRVLYPAINYLGAVDFPLVERMEIFFTFFWTFTVLATAGLQYITANILLQSIFKNNKTSIYAYILSPIVFIIALIPRNTVMVAETGDKIGKLTVFFSMALPILLFLSYLLRKRRLISK